jgi:flagellar hook assembly protein FlgD
VVSEEAVYSPQQVGMYTIRVTSFEGCTYEEEFRVSEECEMKVTHTTGMKLGDSQRTFKIYSNPLVDNLEVWIYNGWGQLVFFGSNAEAKENYIEWNGLLNDTFVQPGAYSVRIRYKNNFENAEKSIWASLTVLE